MESSREHSPDYRVLAVFWTLAEAELARGLLVSDGIAAAFGGTADAALLPGAGVGPIRLLVPGAELEHARMILAGAGGPRSFVASGEPAEAEYPAAEATSWSRAWIALALAAVALIGLAALAGAL